MDQTQNKILQYLKTTKEASVYEIQANIQFWELNPIEKLKAKLNTMVKQGTIKRGNPTKYRIVNKVENKQIKMF